MVLLTGCDASLGYPMAPNKGTVPGVILYIPSLLCMRSSEIYISYIHNNSSIPGHSLDG